MDGLRTSAPQKRLFYDLGAGSRLQTLTPTLVISKRLNQSFVSHPIAMKTIGNSYRQMNPGQRFPI